MRVQILDRAEEDLIIGFQFYEAQEPGLGAHFLSCLYSDIESLAASAGIHRKQYRNYYRLLSERFPFGIFYSLHEETVYVHAVLDCRQDPLGIRERFI